MRFPSWFASTLGFQQEPSIAEENEKIKALAEKYDRLLLCDGWIDIAQFAASDVNAAIINASATEDSRDVVRWNAKRELLDKILARIEETRKNRDDIVTMEREIEDEYSRSNAS